jgi:hypothetical protein
MLDRDLGLGGTASQRGTLELDWPILVKLTLGYELEGKLIRHNLQARG